MVYDNDKIASILRQRGYKLTPQRKVILRVIDHSNDHLTPAAIYERAKRQYRDIGLVTIYRTLELLARLGFICKVYVGDNGRSYLLRRPKGHHHHLICSSCDRVVDFTGCDISKMEERLIRQTGFKIESHKVEFLGQCRDCCKGILKECSGA